jgi:DNA polymerase-3 subunit gamma/tau
MPSSVASASSSIAAPSAGSPAALQGPSDDLAAPGRPENPGVEPGTTHLQQTPGTAAGQRASRPAYDDADPFAGADPYAQEDIPMPTVAPEDDEYSMNDVSLGSPETMSLDDVKQFFEVVKPVEEYGPDDPKNPRNIQHVNKHDSE